MPVTFVAGTARFRIRPGRAERDARLGAAVEQAQAPGTGMNVLRGFRRLALRFSPDNVTPQVHAYQAAVTTRSA